MSSKLCFGAICPHPPIIISTIGETSDLKRVSNTIESMKNLAKIFDEAAPDTVIIISPHGPVSYNQFTINQSPVLAGHFYNFGDFKTELLFDNDIKLAGLILRGSKKGGVPLRKVNIKELDHGTLVPLYYLSKKHPNFKVITIAYSFLDLQTHFEFGKVLRNAIELQNKRIAIVASGDLSHRLTPGAPAGYSPRGKEFDKKLIELLKNKDAKGVLSIDPYLVEEAGQCGYRSIIILLGTLDELQWQLEILSYEGPFGVGYLVANFRLSLA